MHDYLVCCSYDEVLRFKHSLAYAKYHQIQDVLEPHIDMDGLVQVVVDNFDAELSSPNGLVSTHALALLETHSIEPANVVSDTIPRISKADMSNPFGDEEDEILPYALKEKPSPPILPPSNLPDEFYEAQRVSHNRAADMDFTFLKVSYYKQHWWSCFDPVLSLLFQLLLTIAFSMLYVFFQTITSAEEERMSEWSGWNTCQSRGSFH